MADQEQRGLLGDDSPVPIASTVASPAQQLAARHRPGYARVSSVSFNEQDLNGRGSMDAPREDGSRESVDRQRGLGIQGMPSPPPESSKRRVSSPLARNEFSYNSLAGAERTPIISPPIGSGYSGSTKYDTSFGSEDYDLSFSSKLKDPRTSFQSQSHQSLHGAYAKSEAGLLSTRSRYDFDPQHCPSSADIKHGRFARWISIGIILLAFFTTVFSLFFLVLALRAPRYGRSIRERGGSLTPASAAFLTSLFAKLIELSFVTTFVAFVGQALARRAFKQKIARGVTLAEMSMRHWVMQPGTMFTQWESVRYAGITVLGGVSLIAAIVALLYTTASTALVQPQLKWPAGWEPHYMMGLVKTTYANSKYIAANCISPNKLLYNTPALDHAAADQTTFVGDNTCIDMTHVAMAYHNYFTYIDHWSQAVQNGSGSQWLPQRAKGYALFNDNTTIAAPWINQQNITVFNETRYINNITMAMPHIGVVQAASDPGNEIIQPNDVDGAQYNIIASVPSPILNVLCVTMEQSDLAPFVYELWPEYPSKKKQFNISEWPSNYEYGDRNWWLNGTEFDHIFGWGPSAGPANYPPVFPKLPIDYNTLLNDTVGVSQWGRRSIYVLGKGPPTSTDSVPMVNAQGEGTNYALCQMQAGMTASCSTHYNASSSGAQLEAVCEDDTDMMRYDRSLSTAWTGNETLSQEWPNIASEWAKSISLSAGTLDGDSANTRQLTQLIVNKANLSTALPSMAEALAVLGGCTLLEAVADSTFVGHAWNYTLPTLEPGNYEWFNASVRSQEYASGGAQSYQKAFYPVLFAVFIMSLLILIYFLCHTDWYTDFSEPATMFALTLNSPPSGVKLAGQSRAAPSGSQYQLPWKLNVDGGHIYMDSHEEKFDSVSVSSPRLSRKRWTDFDMTPMTNLRGRFSRVGTQQSSAQGTPRPTEPQNGV